MQKNDELVVVIDNLGANGEGVAIIDNMPIFVPFALPNEKVKIKILKALKNFCYAKLIDIIEPSKDRVEPICPVFSKCGGCQLQHLDYTKQLEFKRQLVANNFKKFANISFNVSDCEPSQNEYGYRNKISLPVGVIKKQVDGQIIIENTLGLYAINSNRIVPTNNCAITGDWCNKLVCIALKYLEKSGETPYDTTMQTGNIRHLVARYIDDSLMLTIVTKTGKIKSPDILIEMLQRKFDKFSLFVNTNKQNNNVILGEKFKLIYGESTQKLNAFGIDYEISPQSFLQVNFDIQNKIYKLILDNIKNNAEVINAYSGAGLLTAILSQKAKHAYGIEIVNKAHENANKLAIENKIANMTNICADCAVEMPLLAKKLASDNLTIVLDPPRKGCDENVLKSILEASPKTILYISCNSATLARDVKLLFDSKKYNIDFIKPFDMFPQTRNVETVVKLTKI